MSDYESLPEYRRAQVDANAGALVEVAAECEDVFLVECADAQLENSMLVANFVTERVAVQNELRRIVMHMERKIVEHRGRFTAPVGIGDEDMRGS